MRNLYNYPIGDKSPEEFNVIIEVPTGSNNKYEYNAKEDILNLIEFYLVPFITQDAMVLSLKH